MRFTIAITLILAGGLLVALPTLFTQRNLERVAAYYEMHGGGAQLPGELSVRPHTRYDWASLGAGTLFVLMGAFVGRAAGRIVT
jgi:hypothetical protein